MPSDQQQFVRGSTYHVHSPSGKVSNLEHVGNVKLDGEKILMFKLILKRSKKNPANKRQG